MVDGGPQVKVARPLPGVALTFVGGLIGAELKITIVLSSKDISASGAKVPSTLISSVVTGTSLSVSCCDTIPTVACATVAAESIMTSARADVKRDLSGFCFIR